MRRPLLPPPPPLPLPLPLLLLLLLCAPAPPADGMAPAQIARYRDKVQGMFTTAFDDYMRHAFPAPELRPKSCAGGGFDPCELPMLTLVDAIDTLAVMGNDTQFEHAVHTVGAAASAPDFFDRDLEVNVFETTIRWLGGLLSAHCLAANGTGAPPHPHRFRLPGYDGSLLRAAHDLGTRLLPAFHTKTGIPYGTVNLRHGVPKSETTVASLAGAGSLSLEFGMLSVLTGDQRFANAAYAAVERLYRSRTPLGLLGKHIQVHDAAWTEAVAGVGYNADSFYEYGFKSSVLFGDKRYETIFREVYRAAERRLRVGDWYCGFDNAAGKQSDFTFDSLQAFWPALQAQVGDLAKASRTANAFLSLWRRFGVLPEQFDYRTRRQPSGLMAGPKSGGVQARSYMLRPELAESVYHLYRATGDESWLEAAADIVAGIIAACSVAQGCGYASVGDVEHGLQWDIMPSFYLAETLKYLYLLRQTFLFILPPFRPTDLFGEQVFDVRWRGALVRPCGGQPALDLQHGGPHVRGLAGDAGARRGAGAGGRHHRAASADMYACPVLQRRGKGQAGAGAFRGGHAGAAGRAAAGAAASPVWQQPHAAAAARPRPARPRQLRAARDRGREARRGGARALATRWH